MTTEAILRRAKELDDPFPDQMCPGCGQDITGWERFAVHYRKGTRRGREMMHFPLTRDIMMYDERICAWTRDDLLQRQFRRKMIEEGITETRVPLTITPGYYEAAFSVVGVRHVQDDRDGSRGADDPRRGLWAHDGIGEGLPG